MSSIHPIKLGQISNPATASVPQFSTRPVHPFSLTCAFDRQRGQFVVHAGARAGACAVVTAAALALGAFGYVRSAMFRGGPSAASAAVAPPLSSITTTVAPTKTFSTPPSSKSPSSAKIVKSAKSVKSAKAETPVVSSTPPPAPTIQHHEPAEQQVEQQTERRQPGLKYLVVKNVKTKASAEKVRETLLRKGVATTVERNLPGRSAESKYSLVCLTGFDPDSDQAKLDKQMKRLKALKLDPKPYTWGG